jgi:hypothetical protein
VIEFGLALLAVLNEKTLEESKLVNALTGHDAVVLRRACALETKECADLRTPNPREYIAYCGMSGDDDIIAIRQTLDAIVEISDSTASTCYDTTVVIAE